jgi:hypothetical protein
MNLQENGKGPSPFTISVTGVPSPFYSVIATETESTPGDMQKESAVGSLTSLPRKTITGETPSARASSVKIGSPTKTVENFI